MFRHIGIVVQDLEKQLFFYKDLLGLEVYYNMEEKGDFLEYVLNSKSISAKIIKLGKDNNTIIELLKFNNKGKEGKKNIIDYGYTHIALTINNLQKLYESLLSSNISFLSEPKINDMKTHKVCFCKDFENNIIELVEE